MKELLPNRISFPQKFQKVVLVLFFVLFRYERGNTYNQSKTSKFWNRMQKQLNTPRGIFHIIVPSTYKQRHGTRWRECWSLYCLISLYIYSADYKCPLVVSSESNTHATYTAFLLRQYRQWYFEISCSCRPLINVNSKLYNVINRTHIRRQISALLNTKVWYHVYSKVKRSFLVWLMYQYHVYRTSQRRLPPQQFNDKCEKIANTGAYFGASWIGKPKSVTSSI